MTMPLLVLIVFAFWLGQGPSVAGAGTDNANSNNNSTGPSQPVQPAANPLGTALVPAGPFSFSEPTIRLAAGLRDGTGEIILRSATQQSVPPTLKDVELPRPLVGDSSPRNATLGLGENKRDGWGVSGHF
jgi:hypothetical protein